MNHIDITLGKSLTFLFVASLIIGCGSPPRNEPPYQDLTHSSQVFGREKYYRLYLPDGYHHSEQSYPVIYFFHGWGGRHFKDDNAKLEYEMIKDLVDKYNVILVMWDGNIDEEEPRPYNMGYHENITSDIQMKDYFPELVSHVDSTYRTLTERNHRGIIGFSMGGLMSWFLAGKYPDKVCAAVSMTGSPEFFIGYPQNHTLYPLRHAFKNLEGVKIRMHNSTHDELVRLNEEVHRGALWHGGLAYEYWQFKGGHVVDDPGKTEVFERAMKFVTDAFRDPLPSPERWGHFDLYPEFEVWDYAVNSNKEEPGFLYLKNVSGSGFGIQSLKWLPDGPPIGGLTMDVISAPLYLPNTTYNILKYSPAENRLQQSTAQSDGDGRLKFNFDSENEIGVYADGDEPDLVVVNYQLNKTKHLVRSGLKNNLSLKIFNRGGEVKETQKIDITLTTSDSTVLLERSGTVDFPSKERIVTVPAGTLYTTGGPPSHGDPAWIKLHVDMKLDEAVYKDEVVIPVFFNVPAFDSIRIDDGRLIKGKVYGKGDGNGVVAPGEAIMVYTRDHRLRLYTDDPYVERNKEQLADEVLPAKWPDGFTLSSVVKISDWCPEGHVIEFLGNYETKTHMPIERKVRWGKVSVQVRKQR